MPGARGRVVMVGAYLNSPMGCRNAEIRLPLRRRRVVCLPPAVVSIALIVLHVHIVPAWSSADSHRAGFPGAMIAAVLPPNCMGVTTSVGSSPPREICGLTSGVFPPTLHRMHPSGKTLLGGISVKPVFVGYSAKVRTKGLGRSATLGRKRLAMVASAAFFRAHVRRYAPLLFPGGKVSFRRLGTYCLCASAIGGPSPDAALKGGAAFQASVFLPIIIQRCSRHPSEAGPGGAPPPSGARTPGSRLSPGLAMEDRAELGESPKNVQGMRSLYPSTRIAERTLRLHRTQPPEVAMLQRAGFSVMREVEAARNIRRARGNFMMPRPQLMRIRDISSAAGFTPKLLSQVTSSYEQAMAGVFGAILQDLRGGAISLNNTRIRQQLIAVAAQAVGGYAVAPSSASASGAGRPREYDGRSKLWLLVIFLSGVLAAGAMVTLAMAVVAMRRHPLARAGFISAAEIMRACIISALGAGGSLTAAVVAGFFLPLPGTGADAAKELGTGVLIVGLLFSACAWMLVTKSVKWDRLQPMSDSVEALISEVAELKANLGQLERREI